MLAAFKYHARYIFLIVCGLIALGFTVLYLVTINHLKPVPQSLRNITSSAAHIQVLDSREQPLNVTYQNAWNVHDQVDLHDIPEFLKTAFILSEDKRFYKHNGPDWRARAAALVTNIKSLRAVRGASTMSEQTIRMIHPRPRTIGSRWLEGFDAVNLENKFTKDEIFEFYLNQIPYAANRRGVAQAANYYFNRDLSTLSRKEMLALAVLVRAPGRMDLWKDISRVEGRIDRLAALMARQGYITHKDKDRMLGETLTLEAPSLNIFARDFVSYVKDLPVSDMPQRRQAYGKVKTYLDANLQSSIQNMLDTRLRDLDTKHVKNGAVLIVEHKTGKILTWAVGGAENAATPGRFIDAVTTPRQPGSALKPFLYSLALQRGWTAASIIDDAPFIESVGHGLHSYQNYSRQFYGPVTLRQALGNSLNIPALKALQHVGGDNYLTYLDTLGFTSLTAHPNFYGDGIALGNGEVSLYELVQAYAAIANQGVFGDLIAMPTEQNRSRRRVMPSEIASLMGNILSDPKARRLEFGEYSILNFPVQTAVKTGTSSDYRDSWAVGFNHQYTVGIWMGNLDQTPTDGITGSTGPALLLRSIFSQLNQHKDTRPLILDTKLSRQDLCVNGAAVTIKTKTDSCETYTEWFAPNTKLTNDLPNRQPLAPNLDIFEETAFIMQRPVNGLHIAYDPRIPSKDQAFEFFIQGVSEKHQVVWTIDGQSLKRQGGVYNWPVQKGQYEVSAKVMDGSKMLAALKPVTFLVK